MRILLIGSGGRENALAWALSKSGLVESVLVAPGNPGMETLPKTSNIGIPVKETAALVNFSSTEGVDLTIVGPEQPLADGLADRMMDRGLRVLGPTKEAAKLESSKQFAKDVMRSAGIPTADYETLVSAALAHKFVESATYPLVLKADGLAAGKGVAICESKDVAHEFVRQVMEAGIFGKSGESIVAEEFLEGEEASFIVLANGKNFVPFASSQDHKRLLEKDEGPNTGGMGAYSPAPVLDSAMEEKVGKEVVIPLLSEMEKRGTPFTGILYVGLMLSSDGPKVLEFNVRFGDPEAQAVLPRLDSDFAALSMACVRNRLSEEKLTWKTQHALTVVLAAEGYPTHPKKGAVIEGLEKAREEAMVFHAGTKLENGKLLVNGGRVLSVTALADSLPMAAETAYQACSHINYNGKVFRRDIGWRALKRKS